MLYLFGQRKSESTHIQMEGEGQGQRGRISLGLECVSVWAVTTWQNQISDAHTLSSCHPHLL